MLPTEAYAAPAGAANEVAAGLRRHVLRVEKRDGKSFITATGRAGLAIVNGAATHVLALGDDDPLVHALHSASVALGDTTWKPSASQVNLLGSVGRNAESADQMPSPERFVRLLLAAGQQDALDHLAATTRVPDDEAARLRVKLSDVIKAHRGAQAREDALRRENGELKDSAAEQAQQQAALRERLDSILFGEDKPAAEVVAARVAAAEEEASEVETALRALASADNNSVEASRRLTELGLPVSDRTLRKWRQRYAARYEEIRAGLGAPAGDAGDRQAEQAAEAASKLAREDGLATALAEIREAVAQ